MIVMTNDGAVFSGETAEKLVMRMRGAAFLGEPTVEQYMKAVARRVRIWNGQRINCSDYERFIHDLQKAGLIVRLEPEKYLGGIPESAFYESGGEV